MSEPLEPSRPPPALEELLGEDVSPHDLERLRGVDSLLRSVGAPPPEVPASLTRSLAAIAPARGPLWTRRRAAAAVALAAALSALFFGLGMRAGSGGFDERAAVPMEATQDAAGASALIRLGEADASGNWGLRLEVSGLPPLPRGGYYVLWLERDGEYGGTCGTFRVGEDGSAEVEMNASYRLRDFDAWVITARLPGDPPNAEPSPLLTGDVPS